MLTKERLNELLKYDPVTGLFTRKVARPGFAKGSISGSLKKDGCIHIKIDGKMYLAHRLVFLLETGSFPKEMVDHIDGNRSNNARSNLREATRAENSRNSKVRVTNILGIKGVGFHKVTGKYIVQLRIGGRQVHLGLYEDIELAILVATEARNKYHGEFARHG